MYMSKQMKRIFLGILAGMLLLTGCGADSGTGREEEPRESQNTEEKAEEQEKQEITRVPGGQIRILSGSENQELETIIQECSEATGVEIQMEYKGSVDIMRELENGAPDYDAVWPASSIWVSMGDTGHLIKHSQSISMTPVVFGIRESLAEKLGFVGEKVSVNDILTAIRDGEMSFCMTSATQSNSGASAYIGFLYALLGKQEGLTSEDLQKPDLQADIRELLSGVERSSGSSDWLKDMFLEGDYDAMVNYECLIIDAKNLCMWSIPMMAFLSRIHRWVMWIMAMQKKKKPFWQYRNISSQTKHRQRLRLQDAGSMLVASPKKIRMYSTVTGALTRNGSCRRSRCRRPRC